MRALLRRSSSAAPTRIHCPAPPPCNRACQFRSRLTLAEARVRGRSPAQKKELRHPWLRTSGAILHDRRSAPQGGLNVRQSRCFFFSRFRQSTRTLSIRPTLPAIGLPTVESFPVRQLQILLLSSSFGQRPSLASAGGASRAVGLAALVLATGHRSTALNLNHCCTETDAGFCDAKH